MESPPEAETVGQAAAVVVAGTQVAVVLVLVEVLRGTMSIVTLGGIPKCTYLVEVLEDDLLEEDVLEVIVVVVDRATVVAAQVIPVAVAIEGTADEACS